MSTVVHFLIMVLLLAMVLWVIVFGGIGAAIAHLRGDSILSGVLWGTFLGPIGWAVLILRNRNFGRVRVRRPGPASTPTSFGTTKPDDDYF